MLLCLDIVQDLTGTTRTSGLKTPRSVS